MSVSQSRKAFVIASVALVCTFVTGVWLGTPVRAYIPPNRCTYNIVDHVGSCQTPPYSTICKDCGTGSPACNPRITVQYACGGVTYDAAGGCDQCTTVPNH